MNATTAASTGRDSGAVAEAPRPGGEPNAEHAAFLALLTAARSGDQRAVEDLATQLLPQITAYVRKRGAQEPEALASQVMLEFLRSLDRLELRSAQQLWRYLYRIAHSRVIDERRRVRPDTSGGEPSEITDMAATSFDERVVDKMFVGDLLDQLNEDQREVIEMRFLEDCSIEETANRTGRTLPAVKGLQRRAIRALAVAAGVTFSIAALAAGSAAWLGAQQAEVVTATAPPPPGSTETPNTTATTPFEPAAPLDEGDRQSGIAVLIETDGEVEVSLPRRAVLSVDLPAEVAADLEWRQLDGPGTAVLHPQANGTVEVELPTPGVYTFQVAGDVGQSQPGSGQVTVTAWPPRPATTVSATPTASSNDATEEGAVEEPPDGQQPRPPVGSETIDCPSETTIPDDDATTQPGIDQELGARTVNQPTAYPDDETGEINPVPSTPAVTVPTVEDCPAS
ncbi:MAG: sigma-70 family RNA polymerase sigma factor [Actinomycetota bacterium]